MIRHVILIQYVNAYQIADSDQKNQMLIMMVVLRFFSIETHLIKNWNWKCEEEKKPEGSNATRGFIKSKQIALNSTSIETNVMKTDAR